MQDPMMMDMMMGDPFYFFKLKNRFLRIIHAFRNGPNGRGKARVARALFAPAHKKGGHELGSIPKHPSANVSRLKSTSKTL